MFEDLLENHKKSEDKKIYWQPRDDSNQGFPDDEGILTVNDMDTSTREELYLDIFNNILPPSYPYQK